MTKLIPFKTETTQPDLNNGRLLPHSRERWVETQYYQLNYLWKRVRDLSKEQYYWTCPELSVTFYRYPSSKFEEIEISFNRNVYEPGGITVREAPLAFADILEILKNEKEPS